MADKPLLVRAGEILLGPRWKKALARELSMSPRSIDYMAAGQRKVPVHVLANLIVFAELRQTETTALIEELKKTLENTEKAARRRQLPVAPLAEVAGDPDVGSLAADDPAGK